MPAGNPSSGDDFLPTASWETLQTRARLLQRVRRFFDARGFVEVETPLLSADTVIDRHLDPVPVTLFAEANAPDIGRQLWLQTSPEFGMKRLLAAGAERIYQIARSIRGAERGRLHNPEFTIVEWYRVDDTPEQGIELLAEFGQTMLASGEVERITYQEAFQRHVGVDPHSASIESLAQAARARGVAVPDELSLTDRDDWLHLLHAECVEPRLGRENPVILCDYPASQAALARMRDTTPPVAERFELYFQGVELANGYYELVDGRELRRRNQRANRQRAKDGKFLLPEESRLLEAMEHGLPASCGVAVGFDRLLMLAVGAASIDQVIAFPIERA